MNTSSLNDSLSEGNFSLLDSPDDSEFIRYMNMVGLPCIVIIGVCGNTLSFIVFVLTHLRYKSSSVYLASLNVVDTGFLLALLPVWLGWVHVDIFHMNGCCQTTVYSAYVFSFLSVWIVVSFTIERFVVVFYPLKRSVICTTRRALCIIGGLVAISLISYSYTLWTTYIGNYHGWPTCMNKPEYTDIVRLLSSVDTFVTLVAPTVAIIFLNGSIGFKLVMYYRTRLRGQELSQQQTYRSSSSDSDPHLQLGDEGPSQRLYPESSNSSRKLSRAVFSVSLTATQSQRQRRFQNRTTRTLLAISSIFILLNLPSHSFRVYIVAMTLANQHYELSFTMRTIQELCLFLYYANFASNLFLYTLCSRSFRLALVKLWRRFKRQLFCLGDNMAATLVT